MMAFLRSTCVWIIVCFAILGIPTGASRAKRQTWNDNPLSSVNDLSSLLGQFSGNTANSNNGMALSGLMNNVLNQAGHNSRGTGQGVGQGSDLSKLLQMTSSMGRSPASSLQDSRFLQALPVGPGHIADTDGMELNNLMDSANPVLSQASQLSNYNTAVKTMDLNSLMEMTNSLRYNPASALDYNSANSDHHPSGAAGGVRFKFGDMDVYVETKTVDDVLASQGGMQQLEQLNTQVEQALKYISQGEDMVQGFQQGFDQAGQATEDQATEFESMLRGVATMLAGTGLEDMLQSVTGTDLEQAMNQITQSLDQLPALQGLINQLPDLKDLMDNFNCFLENLVKTTPSAMQDMQRLLTSAVMSLQGLMGSSGSELNNLDQMMQLALSSAQGNVGMLNDVLNSMYLMVGDPSFLQTVNNTQCLVHSLTAGGGGEQEVGAAVMCLQSMLTSLTAGTTTGNPEDMLQTLTTMMAQVENNPQLMAALALLLEMPDLNSAFSMVNAVLGQLDTSNSDIGASMAALQSALTSLAQNQQVLEALSSLAQNPESASLYRELVDMMRGATAGDPVLHQIVVAVNDTVVSVWTGGDLRLAAQRLREMTDMMKSSNGPGEPMSSMQLAFLDAVNSMMDYVVRVIQEQAPTTVEPQPTITATPASTTAYPVTVTPGVQDPETTKLGSDGTTIPTTTSIVAGTTRSQTLKPTEEASTKATTKSNSDSPTSALPTASPTPRPTSPATDDISDGEEDNGNGASRFALSALPVTLAIVVCTLLY